MLTFLFVGSVVEVEGFVLVKSDVIAAEFVTKNSKELLVLLVCNPTYPDLRLKPTPFPTLVVFKNKVLLFVNRLLTKCSCVIK
jgi:hypothetical protein